MFAMGLGPFRFSVRNIPVVSEGQETSIRFAKMNVGTTKPKKQFLGPNDDIFSIDATIFPEVISPAGPNQVAAMRALAKRGIPMPYLSAGGDYFGMMVIDFVGTEKTYFLPNAKAQKITVEIELSEWGR